MTQTHCSVHLPILFVIPQMIQRGWSTSPPVLVNEYNRNIRNQIVPGLTLQLDSLEAARHSEQYYPIQL